MMGRDPLELQKDTRTGVADMLFQSELDGMGTPES